MTRKSAAGTGAPMRAASVAANTSSVPWAAMRAITRDMVRRGLQSVLRNRGTLAAVWASLRVGAVDAVAFEDRDLPG
jgi:hypothetical protein